jgi:hypothetical protein
MESKKKNFKGRNMKTSCGSYLNEFMGEKRLLLYFFKNSWNYELNDIFPYLQNMYRCRLQLVFLIKSCILLFEFFFTRNYITVLYSSYVVYWLYLNIIWKYIVQFIVSAIFEKVKKQPFFPHEFIQIWSTWCLHRTVI